jgi:L-arabinonolactonase
MTEVARVVDADNHLGETPMWNPVDQALWWVNCEQLAELHRWAPGSGEHQSWPMPSRIGGFVHKAGGGVLVALADGVYDFDTTSGALALRAPSPLPPHVKLHECHCDRQGRFWVGSMDHRYPADRSAAGGSFFRLDGNTLTPVIGDIAIANGLAFSPDGTTLYAASSPWRKVRAYDLDPATGAISEGRDFVAIDGNGSIPGGFLDGATVDAQGGYWLAIVGYGQLRRFHPDGTLDRIVSLPFSNPTKPAFGGPDMRTLYVTSTKMMLNRDHPDNAANGGVFALTPGEIGVAEAPFAG